MSTLLDKVVQRHNGHDIILTTFAGSFTLNDLVRETDKYAKILVQHNIKRKRIGILVPQLQSFLPIVMAVNRLGGIVVPLSAQYRSDDLQAVLQFVDPHIVFAVKEHNGFAFAGILEEWTSSHDGRTALYTTVNGSTWEERQFGAVDKPVEDAAMEYIVCTSGSTGVPKGIIHTQQSFEYTLEHYCKDVYQIEAGDGLFVNAPPSAYFGLASVFTALYAGASVIAPDSFDMLRMLRLMQESKPNRIVTTPSIMKAIYTFAHKLAPEVIKTLKAAALGGELMTTESIRELPLPVDCRMVGMYGSTEMGGMMFIEDVRKELDWTLYPDVVCELGEWEDGVYECLIRAPGQFAGYYKAPALTRDSFTADNLFKTGDLIRIHDDRTIEIVGRKKDMIKKGGQQVLPGEIETVLLQHPDVSQAVVIGVPHPVYGEQIVAFTVLEKDCGMNDLYQFCAERIAGYKVPDVIRSIKEIPVRQGKADKLMLRSQFLQS